MKIGILVEGKGEFYSLPCLYPRLDLPHIALGFEHTCALLDSGDVYCWGRERMDNWEMIAVRIIYCQ